MRPLQRGIVSCAQVRTKSVEQSVIYLDNGLATTAVAVSSVPGNGCVWWETTVHVEHTLCSKFRHAYREDAAREAAFRVAKLVEA